MKVPNGKQQITNSKTMKKADTKNTFYYWRWFAREMIGLGITKTVIKNEGSEWRWYLEQIINFK